MITVGAHKELLDLLPKLVNLGAKLSLQGVYADMDVQRRLSVLNRIDTILASDGLGWEDVAEQLLPPAYQPGDLLQMVAIITQWSEDLSDYAKEFLADLQARARQAKGGPVYLTERQSGWLSNLHSKALKRRAQAEKQQPAEDAGSNVVHLRMLR